MDNKNNINVLVVSSKYAPEYAGSGLRAHRTYKRLFDGYGFNRSVLCGSVAFDNTERYDFENVPVYRVSCGLFKKAGGKIAKGINYLIEAALTWSYLLINGPRFGLMHIFGNNNVTSAALTYAKIFNKPLLLEICNVSEKFRIYEPWIIKKLFGNGMPSRSKVVCISKRIKRICLSRGYATEDKIWCRPNPVDSLRFFFIDRKGKERYRKKLGLFGSGDTVLINMGKICPLKNQLFLIEVLKLLPEKYKIVIGGPIEKTGPYGKEDEDYLGSIESRIKEYNLQNRVKTEWRFVENVDEYMKASDIYLMPSRIEACATPVLEALACGLPVVAHRIEGVTTEWIREGINGYLSVLEKELFRDKVKMAASLNISEESMRKIKDETSSVLIDERYTRMIKELAGGE